MPVKIAVIGGTGVYDPQVMRDVRQECLATPYGPVGATIGVYLGKEVAFMARHGLKHTVPPHLVNYRGIINGLKGIGVESIIATAAVGSINPVMSPGQFVFIDQFLDFTRSRPSTFCEEGVVHTDMTEPYCPRLRNGLAAAAIKLELPYHSSGTYVCTEGPRFETAAEISMFKKLGGDLVGMTTVPEAVLAREAGICYATIALVTNFGAGISPERLTHREVLDNMRVYGENLRRLIFQTVSDTDCKADCTCRHALEGPVQVNE